MSVDVNDSEHLIAFEPDHPAQAVASLLRQHGERPRILAFVRAVSRAVQDVEGVLFDVVEASQIGDHTPRNLLERWAAVVGERDAGSLSRTQLLPIVCARITANAIGTATNPASVSGYLALLQQAYTPSTLSVSLYPSGAPVMLVTVRSGPGNTFLPDGVADRATAVARAGRPIGALVIIVEAAEDGAVYGSTPLGYGATYSRLLFAGLE